MKRAPILDKSFVWISSAEHQTVEGLNNFRGRQLLRIRLAQKPKRDNVMPIECKREAK